MKNSTQIKRILRKNLPQLKERYRVNQIGIFGSFVRNEQTPESDIDILVSFTSKPSLFEFIELENYLSELLDTRIDLVMESALKPRIGDHIHNHVAMV